MRIDLVGGLGVGKTTLANAFGELGCKVVREDLSKNHFLERYYQGNRDYNFPSQLWFILTKWEELLENKHTLQPVVYDQCLLNTRAYVELAIDSPDERKMMYEFLDHIEEKIGEADLTIYMDLDPEIQIERIHVRKREMEQGVSLRWVEMLKESLEGHLEFRKHFVLDCNNLTFEDYPAVAENILTYGISYFEMEELENAK